MSLVYVCSHYPAISHSFVAREVRALRRLGVDVLTCSVWRAGEEELLSRDDLEEARRTIGLLPARPTSVVCAHLAALRYAPVRYLRTLASSLRNSPPGIRAHVWRVAYFIEAMMLWERLRDAGSRVHLHAQFADGASDVAMLVARFSGATWSIAVHGPVEFYDVASNRLADKLRDARFALAISDFGRSQLMTLVDEPHWSKLHVVHCGVDPGVFDAGGMDRREGPLRVLAVGRLVHLKGQSLLVEAVAELRERGAAIELTLVGEGPKRPALERLAHRRGVADAVVFAGAVSQDEIVERYRAADVFCLPSFAEGIPVVLMEAMAMGLPVVTTRTMGIPELVEDGVSGRLVAPGRLAPLVAALEELAGDPERRREMGAAGRRRVAAEFDVHRSARRLLTVLSEHGVNGFDGMTATLGAGT